MTKKDLGGRPKAMTPEVIQKLESGFTMDFTDGEACLYAGVSMSTLYDYCSKNPKFSEKKELLKRKPRMKAKMNVAESINNKNVSDSRWILEKKDTEYQPTSKTDITTGGDKINLGGILQDIWDENEK